MFTVRHFVRYRIAPAARRFSVRRLSAAAASGAAARARALGRVEATLVFYESTAAARRIARRHGRGPRQPGGRGRARADQTARGDETRATGRACRPLPPRGAAARRGGGRRRSARAPASRTRPRSTNVCEARSPNSASARRRQNSRPRPDCRAASSTGAPWRCATRRNETATRPPRCGGSGRNAAGVSPNGCACGICGCGAGASSRAIGVAPRARSTSWRGAAACSRSSRSSRETNSTRRHRRCCRGRGGGSPAPPRPSCCRAPISHGSTCDST